MNKPLIIEDGYIFIAVPALLAVLAGYFVNAYAAAVPALLALYFAYFFRNPHRTIPEDDTALLSPADGKVMSVEEVYEDLYLDKKCRKIVIFLSVFEINSSVFLLSSSYLEFKDSVSLANTFFCSFI